MFEIKGGCWWVWCGGGVRIWGRMGRRVVVVVGFNRGEDKLDGEVDDMKMND